MSVENIKTVDTHIIEAKEWDNEMPAWFQSLIGKIEKGVSKQEESNINTIAFGEEISVATPKKTQQLVWFLDTQLLKKA